LSNHALTPGHAAVPSRAGAARSWAYVFLAMALGFPGIYLRLSGTHVSPDYVDALLFGTGIFGAAFLLSWAVEVAQLHISAAFAIAILALIAILPEYAIEAVLAWDAGAAWFPGAHPGEVAEVARVAANVTGANRGLIGVGWSMVVLVYWFKERKNLSLERGLSLELTILLLATGVTFLLFFMQQVALIVAAVLIVMYLFYLWVSSRAETEEPELMGPAAVIGSMQRVRQIPVIILLFAYAAAVIFLAAEPFVDALVQTGKAFGIEEFILIQWLAPLASESPELVVALLFTLRGHQVAAMTTLISSEVNQLTLLIGTMPFIFSLSFGHASGFPLSSHQAVEFLLTSSMSLFAVVLFARLRIGWYGALVLLGVFAAHLFFTDPHERRIFAFIFLGMAGGLLIVDRGRIVAMYHRAISMFKFSATGEVTAEGPIPADGDED
jgi:cation:H+ antiporter